MESTNTCGENGDQNFCVQTGFSNRKSCDTCRLVKEINEILILFYYNHFLIIQTRRSQHGLVDRSARSEQFDVVAIGNDVRGRSVSEPSQLNVAIR